MNIRGVLADGVWQENPKDDKREFFDHFRSRFDQPSNHRAIVDMIFSCFFRINLSSVQKADIDAKFRHFFTFADIPNGCNSSFIALIPKIPNANLVKDFRPISLIGSIYKITEKYPSNRLVMVLGDIVSEVQSAFIVGRQILDGPFILSEVLQWCKSKKKQSLIFKVDFEKAFDLVIWDFLDDVLRKFGFGNKWCEWIQKCLKSSRGSILINGSPTEEFQFFKGLKQVDAGMFKGINLSQSVNLFHMFYADDVVFVGQWTDRNINILTHVLECFYHVSGLRINMSKSRIMGTKVGGIMSRVESWKEVIDKVESRLSKWKMHALSIGGRLTLLKSVLGSILIFYMSIYRVPSSVLQKMESIRCNFFNGYEELLAGYSRLLKEILWLGAPTVFVCLDDMIASLGAFGASPLSGKTIGLLAIKVSSWWNVNYEDINSYNEWSHGLHLSSPRTKQRRLSHTKVHSPSCLLPQQTTRTKKASSRKQQYQE
ncbi:RNA-directed DNA polymerase, eukaryota, reverse transcriptase zinc-binding domain protein, partial [Tanacetum coccineum]